MHFVIQILFYENILYKKPVSSFKRPRHDVESNFNQESLYCQFLSRCLIRVLNPVFVPANKPEQPLIIKDKTDKDIFFLQFS